jgi:uncharacterized membrane protein
MHSYDIFLLLHLLGLVALAAGVGLTMFAGNNMGKAGTPADALRLVGMGKIGERVIIPGAVTLLVTGLILVHVAHYEFDQPWIIAAVVLWIASLTMGKLQGKHGEKVAAQALSEIESGFTAVSDDLRALLNNKAAQVRGQLLALSILAFLLLMVFRPGS